MVKNVRNVFTNENESLLLLNGFNFPGQVLKHLAYVIEWGFEINISSEKSLINK